MDNFGLFSRRCRRTCDRCSFFDAKIAVEKLTGLILLAEQINDTSQLEDSMLDIKFNNLSNKKLVSSLEKFDCTICKIKINNSLEMVNPCMYKLCILKSKTGFLFL